MGTGHYSSSTFRSSSSPSAGGGVWMLSARAMLSASAGPSPQESAQTSRLPHGATVTAQHRGQLRPPPRCQTQPCSPAKRIRSLRFVASTASRARKARAAAGLGFSPGRTERLGAWSRRVLGAVFQFSSPRASDGILFTFSLAHAGNSCSAMTSAPARGKIETE